MKDKELEELEFDLAELQEEVSKKKADLVFNITGLQRREQIHYDRACDKSPIGVCVVDIEDDKHECVFCKQACNEVSSTSEEDVKRVKSYIENRIRRSFKYDWVDNSNPADRMFTETVIELQIVNSILNGNKEMGRDYIC